MLERLARLLINVRRGLISASPGSKYKYSSFLRLGHSLVPLT